MTQEQMFGGHTNTPGGHREARGCVAQTCHIPIIAGELGYSVNLNKSYGHLEWTCTLLPHASSQGPNTRVN